MKIFTGKIVSTKMAKTATVEVVRTVAHPLYGKRVKKTKKYHVHDEFGGKVGDVVHFAAGRPVSKLKKWKVLEILGEEKTGSPVKSRAKKGK